MSVVLTSIEAAPVTPIDKKTMAPFLRTYCIRCHGQEKQKGDVDFRDLKWNVSNNGEAQGWQDILDVLNAGEMPPEDEKQPGRVELSQIIGILTADLQLAQKRLTETGGVYTIRRINEREYRNTIKYLFGLNIDKSFIPDDLRDEHHYDTAGSLQYIDGPLLEQYIHIGTEIAKEALEWSGRPYSEPKTFRVEPEKINPKIMIEGYPVDENGIYISNGGPLHRPVRNITISHGKDPRAYYKLRVRGAKHDQDAPQRHFLMVKETTAIRGHDSGVLNVMKISGTQEEPSTTEVEVSRNVLGTNPRPKLELAEVMFEGITNPGRWFPVYLKAIGSEKDRPSVWVDWVELEGPFYGQKENVFGKLISKDGENLNSQKKARKLLERVAYEAFRHVKPEKEYISKLTAYFESRMDDGLGYEEAMGETIGLILASPGFLYLEEGSRSKQLDSRGYANRLAYFLWSAPPDQELYDAANTLTDPAALRKQVDRMLLDKKANHFYEGFMSQWAELDQLDQITPEWQKFTAFNKGIRYSIYREPIEFFKTMVEENLGVYYLIDSTFLTVNSQLAHFYGLEEQHDSSDFMKVRIAPDDPRGGLMTQAAFLTMGSVGDRTSPVIRGALILEKLLNDPPASPPPNVPELGAASDKPLSNRELVEIHRKQKVCASCHDKMDPIGYSLEHFDAIGLWRETELVGKKEIPVDTNTKLASGKRLKNLRDLQVVIKGRDDQLTKHMIESLLTYGIGRPVEFSDAPDIEKVLKQGMAQKMRMKDLIFAVAHSKTFRGK